MSTPPAAAPNVTTRFFEPAEWKWSVLAVAAFHVAYLVPALALLMGVFLYALVRLTEVRTPRRAFYAGFLVGLACYGPQLWFFVGIFGIVAVALWAVLAVWLGFFVLIGWGLRNVLGIYDLFLALPFAIVWIGLEYFRSELYYLKFSWLTPGFAMGGSLDSQFLLSIVGVYGVGFVLMGLAGVLSILSRRAAISITIGLWGILWFVAVVSSAHLYSGPALFAIAIQLESPSETQVIEALNNAIKSDPSPDRFRTPLLVMSEYTIASPPTQRIRDWCRDHGRYLLIGGIQPLDPTPEGKEQWADTAFVIDPEGEIVFTQGKCVPIQFFDDGQPAKEQRIWHSPWGKVGICICYDLSYSLVTDALIRQGADVLIVIAMDAMSWGAYEHQLHARIAPARAAEYHLGILRVASSGVSQSVSPFGGIQTIPFPNQGARMHTSLSTRVHPRLPPDRSLASLCVLVTAFIVLWLLVGKHLKRIWNRFRTWQKSRRHKLWPGLRD